MKLVAKLTGALLEVVQTSDYTNETRLAFRSLSPDAKWNSPKQCWEYQYAPGVLQELIAVAEKFKAELILDPLLVVERDKVAIEYRQEVETRKLIQRYMDDKNLTVGEYPTLPDPSPWRHQMIAHHWAMRVKYLYLALKPGLGKTRIGADLIRGKHEQGMVRPMQQFWSEEQASQALDHRVLPARWCIKGGVLIVCPRVVVGEWMEQLHRWQNVRAVPIVGSAERKRYRAGLRAWVHVCSYDSLESVERNEYDGIIADELHYIANEDSNRWRRMNVIGQPCLWRVGMSGTPMSNMLKSLWAQYFWLDGGRTLGPSFDCYRRRYFNTSGRHVEEKASANDQVSHAISRITMSQTMQQAFPGKASKIQQVIRVPMTAEQIHYYERLRERTEADVISGKVTMTEATTRIMKLMQVVQGFVIDDNGDVQRFSSAKLKALEDMLTGRGDLTDRRVVVWCRFRPDLDAVSSMLIRHKIYHYVLHGDLTEKVREEVKDGWNNDYRVRVLVGMIQMGIGLNLHAPTCVDYEGYLARCSTTVFFGLDHRVTQLEQAMDRVYRGDQVETCLYRYLLSDELDESDDDGEPVKPIDVKVYEALIEKLEQAKYVSEESVEYIRRLLSK